MIVIYQRITQIGSVANFAAGQVCETAHWLENSVFHHFPTGICGVGTLLVNIVAYSAMTRTLYRRQRIGVKSKSLLIRSVIMVVTFSLSWLPAFVLIDVIKRSGPCMMKWTAQVLLYLNTLTDPLIYVLTPKIIKRFVRRKRVQVFPITRLRAGDTADINSQVRMKTPTGTEQVAGFKVSDKAKSAKGNLNNLKQPSIVELEAAQCLDQI